MIRSIAGDADYARKSQALLINISAAKNIAKILKTNLGPRGTLKLLVGGAGDLRLTKDGNVLLNDMHIKHPTAALIARVATAQDDIVGDGTTSTVLLVGELMSLAERYLNEGAHPSTLVEGLLEAKKLCRGWLDYQARALFQNRIKSVDREILLSVARTALRTKLAGGLADQMADMVVEAVHMIRRRGLGIDLHMVEQMHMQHKMATDTRLVKGLVLDHGPRHPNMPRDLHNCYILTCNVSLEYEKTTIKSKVRYRSAEERRRQALAERRVTDEKVKKIIALKKQVCGQDEDKTFVIINQKGIDPISLAMLAKEGITALRRAKKRNMERLTLACGGEPINSVNELTPDALGWAEHVWCTELGEEKYTFVEVGDETRLGHRCRSCTILYRGPNKHTIAQIKDAVRDGLRAVKNAIDANVVVPGAGCMEVLLSHFLKKKAKTIRDRKRMGMELMAEALLVIPKTLAQNSGLDTQESILSLMQVAEERDSDSSRRAPGTQWNQLPGLDIYTGEVIDPINAGILENLMGKIHMVDAALYSATQILMVDEILRAGRKRH